MYQRKSRICCVLMLAVSIFLRICMLLGLDAKAAAALSAAASQPEFARWMLFLETGQAVNVEEAPELPRLWVLKVEQEQPPAQETAPQPEPEPEPVPAPEPTPTVTPVSADAITVTGGCTYTYDKAALLAQPSTLDFSGEGPHILIVHTHGTEAYTPTTAMSYDAVEPYRTLDASRSVIAVGQALAEQLEANGFSVIHDTAVNDYPSYNDSYWTTLRRIEDWKAQYPNLQMIIDIHRDAVKDDSGSAVALSAQAKGEDCAQLMLVVGTDQGGLSHPGWQENLANALKLQSVLEAMAPGLCRDLDLRTERFNQHMTPGSILVEVGTNGNTLEQALRSAAILADALAETVLLQQTE